MQPTQVKHLKDVPFQGRPLALTHKQQTKLERLARYKHSSLLRKFVNYEPDKFHNIGPRVQSYKTFYVCDLRIFCNRLEYFYGLACTAQYNVCGEGQEPTLEFSTRKSYAQVGSVLTCKHQTRLYGPARDKKISLLQTLVNYGS